MSPESPAWEIREGDVLDCLREMADESVHCVVTSPPYWGLRDYGTPGQIGLEPTPEEYVAKMVEVFREVRRVLRGDGTLWLNMGDSYAGAGLTGGDTGNGTLVYGAVRESRRRDRAEVMPKRMATPGLKPKDLVGIPWRVAFALQADGWWLRSDIIWAKPNPMPESVRDRPTKSHEYVFMLTKSARYFYDADAIREDHAEVSIARAKRNRFGGKYKDSDPSEHGRLKVGENYGPDGDPDKVCHPNGRNKRTVWTITTKPYPEAHFATFPPELPRICIRAGTSERGCCAECGAPWERVVEKELIETGGKVGYDGGEGPRPDPTGMDAGTAYKWTGGVYGSYATTTTGWQPTCDHEAAAVPCIVLDPFAGAGTTGVEALALGRSFIGIELNPTYAKMARERIDGDCPLFNREAS